MFMEEKLEKYWDWLKINEVLNSKKMSLEI
jgi:hypothetical protein